MTCDRPAGGALSSQYVSTIKLLRFIPGRVDPLMVCEVRYSHLSSLFKSRTLKLFSTLLPLFYLHTKTFDIIINCRHIHEGYFAIAGDIFDFVFLYF